MNIPTLLAQRPNDDVVVDLEWNPDRHISAVGVAFNGDEAFSTYSVEPALEAIKKHNGRLIGHNLVDADFDVMGWYPESLAPERVVDTKIAAHLVHAHLAELGLLGLGSMCRYYRPTPNWKHDTADLLEYNGRDCAYNYRLFEDLSNDLDATQQWSLVEKQQRLGQMAALMRARGIAVDSGAIRQFDADWMEKRKSLAFDFPFNPNSPKQVTAWFKQEAQISLKDTRYDTLAKMKGRYEYVDKLLEYKDEGKGIKTWFNEEAAECGYIYPSFNVTGTAVARFSCSEPNCQNIPPYLRHIIVPREAGMELVSFDFSQIENRTTAILADDKQMLADFAAGVDFHTLSASRIFNKRMQDVTGSERKEGKITIHATNYGETAYHLAERLYGSRTRANVEAARLLQRAYLGAYPGIERWQAAVSRSLDSGDVMLRNPFGRIRFVYAVSSHERMKRGAHYMGCSTAAEIVNQKALDVWQELKLLPILIVHDELCYELPKGDAAVRGRIQEVLLGPVKELDSRVFPVKQKAGVNYGRMA